MAEAHIRREATGIRAMILPQSNGNHHVTDTWEREGPLDWLSQLAVEDAACRAGAFSLTSPQHPRTTAENQEDSKAGLRGQAA